CARMDSNFDHW
nr:immunoglobulin heavy chain junction region [Macaca mulatta]MOV49876.1 immunoglobulin heavy chain junction region [Macaca mulatta]MOV50081.1 immunoglobulin heavy chain junction region [Macaca mulatta]MOV51251.1 immunoglobulin heavy chain junction region [Macaca mulatta]MOV51496.1 immunoglobulin heavy chain junction region [Macaca mulatta]